MTTFLRVLDVPVDEKGAALLEAVAVARGAQPSRRKHLVFERAPSEFANVPGSPFAYSLTPRLFELFKTMPRFDNGSRTTRVGLGTLDDTRFLRLWFECSPSAVGSRWVPLANGGNFSRFFSDPPQVVLWEQAGRCLKTYVEAKVGSASRKIQSEAFYFRHGITWPLRAKAFCPQIMPAGCAFSARGYAAFVPNDEVLPLTALGSSSVFDALYKIMLGRFGFPEFLVGTLLRVPLPSWTLAQRESLGRLARRGWSLRRRLDTAIETSHAFLLPSGLGARTTGLDFEAIDRELESIQSEIDDAAFTLYGIGPDDRAAIESSSRRPTSNDEEFDDEDEHGETNADDAIVGGFTDTLTSWLVGVSFARFDLRLATGERAIPPEPDPFDALPARSPGMYPEGEEPADRPDILVDDEGHADDLAARAVAVTERVKVDAPENLRAWLAKEFFPLHIKMYSKSRRKAPIYWQLATPSASYSVWLYIHAFSKDTLFRVQNDYAAPKLAHEERRLESLTSELRDGATAAQRKTLAAQEAVVDELRAFLDEVKRVAPLWEPNLDDGVIINFAPLWRLVRKYKQQQKSWKDELKSTWDALCEGKYDWAHLAMHLWPERVVPRCVKDRSLAIAHGLEDVFWVEGTDGKWTARKTPSRSVDELVRERNSPAVKSALKSLLEAPAAVGTGKRAKAKNKGVRRAR